MENPIIVPFDLNTARKIKSGEIEGSVLIDNIEIEFVYESKDCAGPYTGKAISGENRLLLEVPEYITFYGLPLFKATAVKYGWDNPIGEDSGRERKYDSQY